jgi:hypothetical protein
MKATRAQARMLTALEELATRMAAVEEKIDELLARVPEKAEAEPVEVPRPPIRKAATATKKGA